MTDANVVRGANKRYGDFAALDNVDFEVPSGSSTALLGPGFRQVDPVARHRPDSISRTPEPSRSTVAM